MQPQILISGKGDFGMVKRLRGFVLMFVILFCPGYFIFAQADQEPAGSQAQPEATVAPAEKRYTAEEFAALPDQEKIDVYLNFPWMLPEYFSPELYMDLFYPEFGDEESTLDKK
jgi:hypothetical protein